MGIRNYSNEARPLSLAIGAESDDDLIQVNAPGTTDYPAPPFLLAAERGTAREEIMLCTAKTLNSFTVTRGFDGTEQSSHEPGSPIEHTVAAIDFREANQHVNDDTAHWTPGDMKIAAYPVTAGSEPAGWLVCDGRAVSQTTYQDLHEAIGDAYNIGGEGVGNFRLPDLRFSFPMGKAAAGTGSVLGSRGGSNDATLVTHAHSVSDSGHNHLQNEHNHGGGTHGHGLSGGNHSHGIDTDYGFRILVSHPSGEGTLVNPGNPVQVNGLKYTRTDIDHENVTSPVEAGSTALTVDDGTAGNTAITATNIAHNADISVGNPTGPAHGVATDKNLPKYQVFNYLIKV